MILVKHISEKGLSFFTNMHSKKAISLKETPKASLTFHWEKLGKQIRVQGDITSTTDKEADDYFNSRPRESNIGAWASDQSAILDSRETLEKRYKDLEEKREG
ncbi:MAG: pyridoxal 5'-phosphate synthase, partial [Candidatus Margulisbacteria bacterium]|nr:pyridoxal 5'-phosphate synthase [Candidatus Margulisiibacteriota bacterium]